MTFRSGLRLAAVEGDPAAGLQRPEITPYAHLMVQPEIVAQGLILSAWVARWMAAAVDFLDDQ